MARKKKTSKKKGGYKYSKHTKAMLRRRASHMPRTKKGRFKKKK